MLLLLACAAPTPPLVWLDASAVGDGLAVDGVARSFPIPVEDGATLRGVDLDPVGGEIAWISAGVDVAWLDVGADVDPDAVEVDGDETDLEAIAERLDLELIDGRLVGDDALAKIADDAPDTIDAAWPVVFATDTTITTTTSAAPARTGTPTIATPSTTFEFDDSVIGDLSTPTWADAQTAAAASLLPFVGLYPCQDGPLLLAASGTWSRATDGYDLPLGAWTVDGDTLVLQTIDTTVPLHIHDHRLEGDTLSCPRPE